MVDKESLIEQPQDEKIRVAKKKAQILAGSSVIVTVVLFLIGYYIPMNGLSQEMTAEQRIVFALMCESPVALLFLAMTIFTIGARLSQPKTLNPLTGADGTNEALMKNNRVLQNTVEQFIPHFVSLIGFAAFIDPKSVQAIPILVDLFIVGRIAFWIGYPLTRSFGFVMTMLPTLIVSVYNVIQVLIMSWGFI